MLQCINIHKQNRALHNGIHTQIHKDYRGNPKGKNQLSRASLLSLFLWLHYIKCLQYNIRFLPPSKTPIPNPELETHGSKNPYHGLKIFHWKTTKNNPPRKKFGGSTPKPRIRVADTILVLTNRNKQGGPSGIPHCDPPLAQAYHTCQLVKVGVKLHAKNIIHTQ